MAKKLLDEFRFYLNDFFENEKLLSNQRKLLNDFNLYCNKTQNSKKSIIDYKKCFLAKMEIFQHEIEKAEKNKT